MTRDDVIRMAREVADPDTVDPLCGGDQRDLITLNLDEMVRFAALVAAHERAEELLKKPVAWRFRAGVSYPWSLTDDGYYASCMRNKSYLVEPLYAIRARGEK